MAFLYQKAYKNLVLEILRLRSSKYYTEIDKTLLLYMTTTTTTTTTMLMPMMMMTMMMMKMMMVIMVMMMMICTPMNANRPKQQ